MENCSIPNSNPANGPISTPWSAQLRKSNSASEGFFGALSLKIAVESWTLRLFNAQHSTLNTQHSIQTVGRWTLNARRGRARPGRRRVGCSPRRSSSAAEAGSAFSFSLRRVKGAWWPSRSSKPLSVRKSRGRFDSCPLRLLILDFRSPIFDWPVVVPVSGATASDKRLTTGIESCALPGGSIRTPQSPVRNSKGGERLCRASKFEN